MRHSLVARFILCSLLGGFFAQLDAQSITVRFKTMGLLSGMTGLNYMDGGAPTPLVTEYFNVDLTTHTYSGSNPMTLYHLEQVNGQNAMAPVGNVTFPADASGKDYLLCLAGQGSGPYFGSALPDSLSDFPLNSTRIVNATPIPLLASCAGKDAPLKPGQYSITPLGDLTEYGVSAKVMRNGTPVQVCGSIYDGTPTVRFTVFLVATNAADLRTNPNATPSVRMIPYEDDGNQQSSSSSSSKKHRNNTNSNNNNNNGGFDQ